MSSNWRITSFNGVLLAAYFIPTWAIIAWQIVTSPVRGLFERPSVAVALYATDHLQLPTMTAVRFAWLLALGRLTVVAFEPRSRKELTLEAFVEGVIDSADTERLTEMVRRTRVHG